MNPVFSLTKKIAGNQIEGPFIHIKKDEWARYQ